MNVIRSLIATSLLVASISGCSGGNSVFHDISIIDHTHIAVHARMAPDAHVSSDGTLSVSGKTLATTPLQQNLLRRYFASVIALHDDAIATGKAGIETAKQAIGSLATAAASRDTAGLDKSIDAKATVVDKSAARVCRDLSAIVSTQDAIAASLPAFRPYALVRERNLSDCDRN